MEIFNNFVDWLTAHETALSAFAALVVTVGVALSPMGATLRSFLRARQAKAQSEVPSPSADQPASGDSPGAPPLNQHKPTIAVLPFENLCGEPDQEYFAQGIAEDIIVALSKLHSLIVIARNTSFAYKERGGTDGKIGKALGARYIVRGSVRKFGDRARITAALVDTETEEQLWADRYDRNLDDVFLVQDEITGKVLSILPSRIEAADLKRTHNKSTANLKAYEYLLRGKYHHHLRTQQDNQIAYEMLGRAIEADPRSAQAYAWRACVIGQAVVRGYRNDEHAIPEVLQNVETALALDDEDFECHRVLLGVCTFQKNYDRAEFHAERAFELNPNDPRVISQYGELLALTGRPEAAIERLQQALLVDPYSPDDRLTNLGFAQFVARQYRAALATFNKVSSLTVKQHAYLAACYAQLDELANARRHAEEVSRLDPTFAVDNFVTLVQYKNDSDYQHHADALRKAGL